LYGSGRQANTLPNVAQAERPENRLPPARAEPNVTGMYAMMITIVAGFGPAAVVGRPCRWAPEPVKRPRQGRTVLAVQDASGV
jgi:hypothetical protein